jgi:hypothetical protein
MREIDVMSTREHGTERSGKMITPIRRRLESAPATMLHCVLALVNTTSCLMSKKPPTAVVLILVVASCIFAGCDKGESPQASAAKSAMEMAQHELTGTITVMSGAGARFLLLHVPPAESGHTNALVQPPISKPKQLSISYYLVLNDDCTFKPYASGTTLELGVLCKVVGRIVEDRGEVSKLVGTELRVGDTDYAINTTSIEVLAAPASSDASSEEHPWQPIAASGSSWAYLSDGEGKVVGMAYGLDQGTILLKNPLESETAGSDRAEGAALEPGQKEPPTAIPSTTDEGSTKASKQRSGSTLPTWTVPADWEPLQSATDFQVAKFRVRGEDGALADLTVIKMSGEAGGFLANVNRWRAQLRLQPVDDGGMKSSTAEVSTPAGSYLIVQLLGADVRTGRSMSLVGAILRRPQHTWFYKLMGDPDAVARHNEAFLRFLRSASYRD